MRPEFVAVAHGADAAVDHVFRRKAGVPEQLDALTADIEEYPAIAMSLTDKLFALLGLSKDISVKKL